ncbi:hypothetical protein HDU83_000093 [Entophlyctis luteolus]|nr:hypothetical protein HDU82_005244 [Entophlyctis luteolus]KAJ3358036.1 hypothetical protein HDU83_000093 [Entophlyctis luteolus]KAJ3395311.1 hypothetical protein HDU84_000078 [Entophlyctis sp. JEL0112]
MQQAQINSDYNSQMSDHPLSNEEHELLVALLSSSRNDLQQCAQWTNPVDPVAGSTYQPQQNHDWSAKHKPSNDKLHIHYPFEGRESYIGPIASSLSPRRRKRELKKTKQRQKDDDLSISDWKCVQCGATEAETPLKRKGPDKKRNYCNACYVRWRVKVERSERGSERPVISGGSTVPLIQAGSSAQQFLATPKSDLPRDHLHSSTSLLKLLCNEITNRVLPTRDGASCQQAQHTPPDKEVSFEKSGRCNMPILENNRAIEALFKQNALIQELSSQPQIVYSFDSPFPQWGGIDNAETISCENSNGAKAAESFPSEDFQNISWTEQGNSLNHLFNFEKNQQQNTQQPAVNSFSYQKQRSFTSFLEEFQPSKENSDASWSNDLLKDLCSKPPEDCFFEPISAVADPTYLPVFDTEDNGHFNQMFGYGTDEVLGNGCHKTSDVDDFLFGPKNTDGISEPCYIYEPISDYLLKESQYMS